MRVEFNVLENDGGELVIAPLNDKTHNYFKKLKVNQILSGEVTKHNPRSLQHHRLFFALCKKAIENTDRDWEYVTNGGLTFKMNTTEQCLEFIKFCLGMYKINRLDQGVWKVDYKSISFDNMGQDRFSEFFNDAVEVICTRVLNGADHASVIDEINQTLN